MAGARFEFRAQDPKTLRISSFGQSPSRLECGEAPKGDPWAEGFRTTAFAARTREHGRPCRFSASKRAASKGDPWTEGSRGCPLGLGPGIPFRGMPCSKPPCQRGDSDIAALKGDSWASEDASASPKGPHTHARHGQCAFGSTAGSSHAHNRFFSRPPGNPVTKTYVRNLDLKCVRPQRAGVIIYTVVDNATYIGIGLDSRTHDLTDFGGGVSYKTDKDAVRGALRELSEETLGVFGTINPEQVGHCAVVYDRHNLIIFARLEVDPDQVSKVFRERHDEAATAKGCKRPPEVCAITWLSWEDFQRSVQSPGVMFSRVQKFLRRAGDFSYLL